MSPVKVLFVGGHPKGCSAAFDEDTLSGKRLRRMVGECNFEAVSYFDLWSDDAEEEAGKLSAEAQESLVHFLHQGFRIVALGDRVGKALSPLGPFAFVSLPHPAARRRSDLQKLTNGIRAISLCMVPSNHDSKETKQR